MAPGTQLYCGVSGDPVGGVRGPKDGGTDHASC